MPKGKKHKRDKKQIQQATTVTATLETKAILPYAPLVITDETKEPTILCTEKGPFQLENLVRVPISQIGKDEGFVLTDELPGGEIIDLELKKAIEQVKQYRDHLAISSLKDVKNRGLMFIKTIPANTCVLFYVGEYQKNDLGGDLAHHLTTQAGNPYKLATDNFLIDTSKKRCLAAFVNNGFEDEAVECYEHKVGNENIARLNLEYHTLGEINGFPVIALRTTRAVATNGPEPALYNYNQDPRAALSLLSFNFWFYHKNGTLLAPDYKKRFYNVELDFTLQLPDEVYQGAIQRKQTHAQAQIILSTTGKFRITTDLFREKLAQSKTGKIVIKDEDIQYFSSSAGCFLPKKGAPTIKTPLFRKKLSLKIPRASLAFVETNYIDLGDFMLAMRDAVFIKSYGKAEISDEKAFHFCEPASEEAWDNLYGSELPYQDACILPQYCRIQQGQAIIEMHNVEPSLQSTVKTNMAKLKQIGAGKGKLLFDMLERIKNIQASFDSDIVKTSYKLLNTVTKEITKSAKDWMSVSDTNRFKWRGETEAMTQSMIAFFDSEHIPYIEGKILGMTVLSVEANGMLFSKLEYHTQKIAERRDLVGGETEAKNPVVTVKSDEVTKAKESSLPLPDLKTALTSSSLSSAPTAPLSSAPTVTVAQDEDCQKDGAKKDTDSVLPVQHLTQTLII